MALSGEILPREPLNLGMPDKARFHLCHSCKEGDGRCGEQEPPSTHSRRIPMYPLAMTAFPTHDTAPEFASPDHPATPVVAPMFETSHARGTRATPHRVPSRPQKARDILRNSRAIPNTLTAFRAFSNPTLTRVSFRAKRRDPIPPCDRYGLCWNSGMSIHHSRFPWMARHLQPESVDHPATKEYTYLAVHPTIPTISNTLLRSACLHWTDLPEKGVYEDLFPMRFL